MNSKKKIREFVLLEKSTPRKKKKKKKIEIHIERVKGCLINFKFIGIPV